MPDVIGARLRRYRTEHELSLGELATKAGVAKSYLSALENSDDQTERRPSAETLYRLATALGVAVSDLLGRSVEQTDLATIPASLRQFAAEARLPKSDVEMLASIRFRGNQPESAERWEFIYRAIKHSRSMDEAG